MYQMMAPIFHELMNDYMNKNRSRSVSPGALIHQQAAAGPGNTSYSPVQTFYHQSHHQLPPNSFYG